jgi:acyl carrier protein
MERSQLVDLIIATVQDFALSNPELEVSNMDEDTRLFGSRGLLDSLGLVSVVLDVEQQINDQLNTSISIADERAMSQSRSPFRSVGSLADYIAMLLQEQQS